MSEILQKILDNYADPTNETLVEILNDLDDARLRLVLNYINEVEEKHGECKLRKVTLRFQPARLSIKTDHPDDTGVSNFL